MKKFEVEVWGIAIDPFNQSPIVVLRNKENRKEILPIWIGHAEATGIMMYLNNIEFGRPLTYELLKNILKTLSAEVESVEITHVKDGTYYAVIHLRDKEGAVHEVDSRPSDAINIALRCGAPIYVSEEVMESSKVILDENLLTGQLAQGVEPDYTTPPVESENGSKSGFERKEGKTEEDEKEIENLKNWLENIKPSDFDRYGRNKKRGN
jgi:bifunctional DNase/RNase